MVTESLKPNPSSLQDFLGRTWPERAGAEVADLHEISAGWESDVYAFDLIHDGERDRLVLRIYPGEDAWNKSAREFEAIRRLHGVGYPVPEVYLLARTSSPYGKPFIIMERVDGHGMWHETFHGPEAQQQERMELFCRLFVQLHSLDWRALTDDDLPGTAGPYGAIDRYLGLIWGFCERFGQPGYLVLMDWLSAHRDAMACERPAPIHWDFHPENMMLRADGSAVVIDWTQFEISDPRFDLAWTMMLVGCAEGEGVRERILGTYERIRGCPVREIEAFEVVACAKRLASVTMSLSAGPEALGMRPGAGEIMRRQLPALVRVYERLQILTGLRVPEVDQLFNVEESGHGIRA